MTATLTAYRDLIDRTTQAKGEPPPSLPPALQVEYDGQDDAEIIFDVVGSLFGAAKAVAIAEGSFDERAFVFSVTRALEDLGFGRDHG